MTAAPPVFKTRLRCTSLPPPSCFEQTDLPLFVKLDNVPESEVITSPGFSRSVRWFYSKARERMTPLGAQAQAGLEVAIQKNCGTPRAELPGSCFHDSVSIPHTWGVGFFGLSIPARDFFLELSPLGDVALLHTRNLSTEVGTV